MKKIVSLILIFTILISSSCSLQQVKKDPANAGYSNTVDTAQLTEHTTSNNTTNTSSSQTKETTSQTTETTVSTSTTTTTASPSTTKETTSNTTVESTTSKNTTTATRKETTVASETETQKASTENDEKETEKLIAITFDDGPCANTSKILDIFKKYNSKATFFIMGDRIETSTNTLQRMIDEGHEIGNHTWDHSNLSKLSKKRAEKQISRTNIKMYRNFKYKIKLLRPSYGASNKTIKSIAKKNDMALINWNIDTLDWETKNKNKIYRVIKRTAKDGNIILCHDLYDATVEAMEKAVPYLIKKGYKLVTVSELLEADGNKIKDGTLYYSQNEYYE